MWAGQHGQETASTYYYLFLAYGILVPQPGMESVVPAVKVLSFNHWTAREFLESAYFILKVYLFMACGNLGVLDQGQNPCPLQGKCES